MDNSIDIIMRVGSENLTTQTTQGKLKIKQSTSLKKSLKLDLIQVIEKDVGPALELFSLKDLSTLLNGIISIYYSQQMLSHGQIQNIHDTLICPLKTTEPAVPKSRKATTRRKAKPGSKVTTSKLIANLSQLLSRKHFIMLNQSDYLSESLQKSQRKRYSGASSLLNNEHNPSVVIDQDLEMEMIGQDLGENLSYSITQRLQDVRNQLNIDLTEMVKNGALDEDQGLLFSNLDINNAEISNMLQTPPTMRTNLHSFRHEHDLRNQYESQDENSSQSTGSEGQGPTGTKARAFLVQIQKRDKKIDIDPPQLEEIKNFDEVLKKKLEQRKDSSLLKADFKVDKFQLINPATIVQLPKDLQNSEVMALPGK